MITSSRTLAQQHLQEVFDNAAAFIRRCPTYHLGVVDVLDNVQRALQDYITISNEHVRHALDMATGSCRVAEAFELENAMLKTDLEDLARQKRICQEFVEDLGYCPYASS